MCAKHTQQRQLIATRTILATDITCLRAHMLVRAIMSAIYSEIRVRRETLCNFAKSSQQRQTKIRKKKKTSKASTTRRHRRPTSKSSAHSSYGVLCYRSARSIFVHSARRTRFCSKCVSFIRLVAAETAETGQEGETMHAIATMITLTIHFIYINSIHSIIRYE